LAEADPQRRLGARGAITRKEEPRNANQTAAAALGGQPPTLHVIDDLPDVVPVRPRELDVIETYLGAVLDELLRTRE
jgi:hypothetical protein